MSVEGELARGATPVSFTCGPPSGASRRTIPRGLSVGIGAWCLLAFSYALARYASVHHRTFDLGLYARMAWGVVRGDTWDPVVGGSFFGAHVPWVLVPLGALGEIFGTVPTLLAAQALAVAFAAFPLARFAARRAGSAGAVAAALAWLAYPNLFHVATYEFHPGTLAVWPLAEALDALDRGRLRSLVAWCLLAVACRASLALTVACIGVLVLVRSSARRTGALVVLASAAYLALVVLVPPALGAARGTSLDEHYGIWGGSPLGVVAMLARDPGVVVRHFAEPARLVYPLVVLAPLALLPLAAPRWLFVALPTLALAWLSEFPTATQLDSHYLTPAVPALVVAALDAACRLAARRRVGHTWLAALGTAALAGSALAGGAPWSRDHVASDFRAGDDTRARRRVLAQIPPSASVQAPDALLAHLARRRVVHRAPPPERETDVVVLDVSHRERFAHTEDLLRTTEEPLARRWLARSDHALVAAEPGLLVLRRGGDPRSGAAARSFVGTTAPDARDAQLSACLALRDARVERDAVVLDLHALAPCPPDLAVRIGTGSRPRRVDLLFDGLLSPAHLRPGDLVRSTHALSHAEHTAIAHEGLRIGLLRSSGAPPEPSDPVSVAVAQPTSGP